MSHLTALIGFIFLGVPSAWAQMPAPAPGATPGSPPAGATGGGIMDYWWVILLVIIIAAAVWYFSHGRNRVEARVRSRRLRNGPMS